MHPKDRPGADLMSALRGTFSTDQFIGDHDVADVLDAVFGTDWQVEHSTLNGAVCCRLGIRFSGEWLWRSSGGDDHSSAFRHAAEMWGIGRLPSAAAEADEQPPVDADKPLRIVRERGGVAHQSMAVAVVPNTPAPHTDRQATPTAQMVSGDADDNPPLVDEIPWGEPATEVSDDGAPGVDSNAVCNDLCKEFQSISNAHLMAADKLVHVAHLQAAYPTMRPEHQFLVNHAVCRHLIDILSFLKAENHGAMEQYAAYRDLLTPYLGEAKLKFELEQNKTRAKLGKARRPNTGVPQKKWAPK